MAGCMVHWSRSVVEPLERRALLAAFAFAPPVTSPLGAAFEVAAADFNGDSIPDLVVARRPARRSLRCAFTSGSATVDLIRRSVRR